MRRTGYELGIGKMIMLGYGAESVKQDMEADCSFGNRVSRALPIGLLLLRDGIGKIVREVKGDDRLTV